jgi:hypothetical protein
LALVLFSLASGDFAHAQSTASLSGTITDPAGAAIPNAQVVAKNQATGVESTTESDASGAYQFPSLPIGAYRIQVTATNFQVAVVTDLKLEVATAATQNIQLKVGEVSEHVLITAEAALVETATTSLGQVIDEKTVQEIPLNGRHLPGPATRVVARSRQRSGVGPPMSCGLGRNGLRERQHTQRDADQRGGDQGGCCDRGEVQFHGRTLLSVSGNGLASLTASGCTTSPAGIRHPLPAEYDPCHPWRSRE